MPTAQPPHALDGHDLLTWAETASQELEARRAEINALNVFPIPDADTGSNMAHTMKAAVDYAHSYIQQHPSSADDASAVATALSTGAVQGARGNSGVVLSQVLRGLAQSAHDGVLSGKSIKQALSAAVDFITTAIQDPVEGTVLTVLRSASEAAHREPSDDLADIARTAATAAHVALDLTPSQLPALRQAGVVDAGGQGLVILLDALLNQLASKDTTPNTEVMFYIQNADLTHLKKALDPLGDSLIVAPLDDTTATTHIHTHVPETVLDVAQTHGTITNIRTEELPQDTALPTTQHRTLIAATPHGDIATLFQELGAHPLILNQDNPSDNADIELTGETLLLPNGLIPRTKLNKLATQAQLNHATLTIIPSPNLISGLAALSMHNNEALYTMDAYAMSEALLGIRTLTLKKQDQHIVIYRLGQEIARRDSLNEALDWACKQLVNRTSELLTILINDSLEETIKADTLEDVLTKVAPLLEVVMYNAGESDFLVELGVE